MESNVAMLISMRARLGCQLNLESTKVQVFGHSCSDFEEGKASLNVGDIFWWQLR